MVAPPSLAGRPLALAPLAAHHGQNKATKGHVKNRPKKSRLSDKNRKQPSYKVDPLDVGNKPEQFTVVGEGAIPEWRTGVPEGEDEDVLAVVEEIEAEVVV